MVSNCEIHKKVFIYVYLQFKSEFKENYLASTSLKLPLSQIVCIFRILCEVSITPVNILNKNRTPLAYTYLDYVRVKNSPQIVYFYRTLNKYNLLAC